jgi:hypothetical protein
MVDENSAAGKPVLMQRGFSRVTAPDIKRTYLMFMVLTVLLSSNQKKSIERF